MDIKENVKKINIEIENLKKYKNILYDVTICAATKYVGPSEIKLLLENGINNIGENKVDAFLQKYEILCNENIIWHYIGSLQTNKVKKIINKVDILHSLDRENLAYEINKYREKPINCFVEVNCSREENKHGIKVEDVKSFIYSLEKYDKINIIGLMTMAMNTSSDNIIRNTFKELKQIQEEIQNLNLKYAPCNHLSMGMSNDFKIAIEEGATYVRIGSKLFE